MNQSPDRGEQLWRWTLRLTGLSGFLLCGILLVLQREIPVVYLLISGGAMGLDSIQGFELRRKRNGG
jgi:hypothetical protein